MSCRLNCSGGFFSTDGTGSFLTSGFCAGRFLSHCPIGPTVTLSRDYSATLCDLLRSFGITEEFSAFSAGPVLDIACCCTGRCLRFRLGQIMRVRQFLYRALFLVTRVVLAGPGLKSFLVLCRGLHFSPIIPVMACRRNLYSFCCSRCCPFLVTEKITADAAFPMFLVSCVCAGRVHRFYMRECMPCSCDLHSFCCSRCCSFLVTEKITADAAFPMFLVSCVCTGSGHRVHFRECMACSCDLYRFCCGRCYSFLVTEKITADAAFPMFLVSCVCAGRAHRFHMRECMACSCDLHSFCCSRCCSFLVTEKSFADAAFPVFLVSGLCTCCCFRFHVR